MTILWTIFYVLGAVFDAIFHILGLTILGVIVYIMVTALMAFVTRP